MNIPQPLPSVARPQPRRRAVLGLLGALALVAAACGSDEASGKSPLSVEITTPGDGADVGESFTVDVDASVAFGEPDTGDQHLHVYIDGNTNAGEYTIVYDDQPVTVVGLTPGEHTIEARIANADHSLTEAQDEITVTVDGAGSEGADEQPAPVPAPSAVPDDGY